MITGKFPFIRFVNLHTESPIEFARERLRESTDSAVAIALQIKCDPSWVRAFKRGTGGDPGASRLFALLDHLGYRVVCERVSH